MDDAMKSPADERTAGRFTDLPIPPSDFASNQANERFARMRAELPPYYDAIEQSDIARIRKVWDESETLPALETARTLYPVNIRTSEIGGIRAEIVTPSDGLAPENHRRILINLHGGGFIAGSYARALLEAVPVVFLPPSSRRSVAAGGRSARPRCYCNDLQQCSAYGHWGLYAPGSCAWHYGSFSAETTMLLRRNGCSMIPWFRLAHRWTFLDAFRRAL